MENESFHPVITNSEKEVILHEIDLFRIDVINFFPSAGGFMITVVGHDKDNVTVEKSKTMRKIDHSNDFAYLVLRGYDMEFSTTHKLKSFLGTFMKFLNYHPQFSSQHVVVVEHTNDMYFVLNKPGSLRLVHVMDYIKIALVPAYRSIFETMNSQYEIHLSTNPNLIEL